MRPLPDNIPRLQHLHASVSSSLEPSGDKYTVSVHMIDDHNPNQKGNVLLKEGNFFNLFKDALNTFYLQLLVYPKLMVNKKNNNK